MFCIPHPPLDILYIFLSVHSFFHSLICPSFLPPYTISGPILDRKKEREKHNEIIEKKKRGMNIFSGGRQ